MPIFELKIGVWRLTIPKAPVEYWKKNDEKKEEKLQNDKEKGGERKK